MQIEYLPKALQDITRTVDYLCYKLLAQQAAEDLMAELDLVVTHILQFPYGFPLYQTTKPLRAEIRFAMVKNYVLYYAVLGDIVQVRRFLHKRQDRENYSL